MTKAQEREAKKIAAREAKQTKKVDMEVKYDGNIKDSDDSSDEEVLIRTGNVPRKWYELYDHVGYDAKGGKVAKNPEQDELAKFLER
mgnify:CR=1 FL=1